MCKSSRAGLGFRVGVAVACVAVGSGGGIVAQARDLVDATQAKVHLVDHPLRIVTLAPSLGELAADFSGTDLTRIVGVSEYTDYPPALSKVASVGPYSRFNLEKVVGLKPDLVLATLDGNPKDQVLHLRELGMPVLVVATSNLSDVEGSMKLVGAALGVPQDGEAMSKRFAIGLAKIKADAPKGARRSVLLQLGEDPLVVAGGGAFLNDALEAVSAHNAYADTTTHYPRPSLEDIVHRDPDVIVVLALGKPSDKQALDAQDASFKAMAERWTRFPALKAVKAKRVRVVQGDSIVRPTLRLLEGLSLLKKAVYGEE